MRRSIFVLENAGFGGFRVLLFQQDDGIKAASGKARLKFTVDFGVGMLNAMNLGDTINEVSGASGLRDRNTV